MKLLLMTICHIYMTMCQSVADHTSWR